MKFSHYLLLTLKGCAMGMADVVPGVSGGTIAFISGIYEELIESIRSVGVEALRLLARGRLTAFWHHINGSFLLAVLLHRALNGDQVFFLHRFSVLFLLYRGRGRRAQ